MLQAVKASTGWGILANTSFNTKGRPLVNRHSHALTMLDELVRVRTPAHATARTNTCVHACLYVCVSLCVNGLNCRVRACVHVS